MQSRFFFDEDVHAVLAEILRKRGYDAIHAGEVQRLGLSDESQLNFAAEKNRCIVTFNVGDFVRLHNHWIKKGREHAGIVVSKQLPVGESLRRLLILLQKEDAESMRGQVRFL
jgi:hypothetical protein